MALTKNIASEILRKLPYTQILTLYLPNMACKQKVCIIIRLFYSRSYAVALYFRLYSFAVKPVLNLNCLLK